MKPIIFYISDALCGWCHGMGPQISKLYDEYADRFHFEVLSGGMVTGERVGPISNMSDYIKGALPRLTEITGVSMGKAYHEEILDKGTFISNSVPPSIALSIFKELHPEEQVKYAKAIQHLHFEEGKDLNDVETYLPLAQEAGLTEEQFRERFADDTYRLAAQQEFAQAQAWGIQGFPSMVVQQNDKLYLIARGYSEADALSKALDQILTE